MVTDSKQRQRLPNLKDLELSNLAGDTVDMYFDAVGRTIDMVDRTYEAALEASPYIDASTAGGVARGIPDAYRRVLNSVRTQVSDLDEDMRDAYDRAFGGQARGTSDNPWSDADIVRHVKRRIRLSRYGSVPLDRLVSDMADDSGQSVKAVTDVINDNFDVDGKLVSMSGPNKTERALGLPAAVSAHLKALGYSDLRHKVELDDLEDEDETIPLVAFKDDAPVVAVFRTMQLHNDAALDDMLVAALSIGGKKQARFLYLTDGVENRYYDIAKSAFVDALPAA